MDRPIRHIITGEYPPRPGGVGDHSALVAGGLARAGTEVHVWTTAEAGPAPPEVAGVTVHREAGRWSPAGLGRLDRELEGFATPRRLLVEYTPFAWGRRGLNLGFARWLRRRQARGDVIRAMVHEAIYPFEPFGKPTRWLLFLVQGRMLRHLIAASDRLDVAIPGWEVYLRAKERGGRRPITWLPVPSNIPVADDPEGVAAIRARVAPRGERIVGTFGTYGGHVVGDLRELFPALLLDSPDRVGLLLGRNGREFAAELVAAHPGLAGRLVAPGGLEDRQASLHLQAADVMVQPYPDGISTRRGSIMAGLAHGAAVVTTRGHLTEPFWEETDAVALVPAGDPAALARRVDALLADPAALAGLGRHARSLYDARFDVRRTVEAILAD